MRIGLISDTHGTLPAEVFRHFEGVDRIVHAGDIGSYDLVMELEAIAPVTAVFGNMDRHDVRDRIGEVAGLDLAGRRLEVVHGHQLGGTPKPPELRAMLPAADIIVYGHTHRPPVDRDGALVINPGSAGAPRPGLRPSVGILTLEEDMAVELIDLE